MILCNLVSCKGEPVLDIPREEVIARLKNGNIAFIMETDITNVQEIAKVNPSASFYGGLLVRSRERAASLKTDDELEAAEPIHRSLPLFQAALGSPAIRIREEAARALLIPVLEGEISAARLLTHIKNTVPASKSKPKEMGESIGLSQDNPVVSLQAASLYTLGRFNEAVNLLGTQQNPSSWDKAIAMLSMMGLQHREPHHEKYTPEQNILRGNLLGFFLRGTPDNAHTWSFRKILQQAPDFFTEAETAAVLGRFAVSETAYAEALRYFRLMLEQDPSLFFQYPELTGDLGRGFQYTGAQEEGIQLFLKWDKQLQSGGEIHLDDGVTRGNPYIDVPAIRYRLLYFTGRIERQRGNYLQAAAYFKAALPFAPDALQEDACMWYILNTTWLNKRQDLLPVVYAYMSRWHDPPYFADMLDLLCRYLTANRQWKSMLELFSQIRFRSLGATAAKYAYILGRAVSEGYIPATEAAVGLNVVGMEAVAREKDLKTVMAQTFFRIAFEEGGASFYYRALSATRLGDKVLPLPAEMTQTQDNEEPLNPQDFPHKDEMELLLGFFEFGATAYILPYLSNVREDLAVWELRVLAKTLADRGEWIESIRLVNAYMERDDYEITYADMYLYYPKAFMDIIEKNAQEAGIPPEILYGLIRTESAFDSNIRSHVGAIGLSQLMPDTAREEAWRIKKRGGPDYLDNLDLRDPAVNVHIGASYLSYLLNIMKSPMQALLSYNGGYNRVRRWRAAEPNLPEDLFLETIELIETREYGKRVLAAAAAYGYLYFDMTMEAVVGDIFR